MNGAGHGYLSGMDDDAAGLDRLSTEDLRDRAFDEARRRWDLQFFWRLIKSVPAAEAAAGHLDPGPETLSSALAQVSEALDEHASTTQEELRPLYLAYLTDFAAGDEPGR